MHVGCMIWGEHWEAKMVSVDLFGNVVSCIFFCFGRGKVADSPLKFYVSRRKRN